MCELSFMEGNRNDRIRGVFITGWRGRKADTRGHKIIRHIRGGQNNQPYHINIPNIPKNVFKMLAMNSRYHSEKNDIKFNKFRPLEDY